LLRQNSQPLEDMCPTSDRTSQLLEDIDVEEQGEEDEGFINLLGEETTVTNLLGLDDSFLIGPPVPPAAPLPSVQTPSAAPSQVKSSHIYLYSAFHNTDCESSFTVIT